MTTTDEFSPLTLAEIVAATSKNAPSKVDSALAERIATLGIGGGFQIKRTENEIQKTFKTRINRAALAAFRTLTWYPQTNLLADGKPGTYVVKVTAIDVKAQSEAEARQSAQNGTVQGQQTTEDSNTGSGDPTDNAPQGRVRGR